MNKRKSLDLAVAGTFAAILLIALLYRNESIAQNWVMGISAGIIFLCLLLAFQEESHIPKQGEAILPAQAELITELVLLSEEDTELMVWDLYGKISMVIGRDVKENHVDVDLSCSSYAGTVDVEHAVLNYMDGSWYVEDLGSKNGISIRKRQDGRNYKLSSDRPCLIECGDCILVGLSRLLLR